MSLHHRLLPLVVRPHLPRRTIRLRLTVLYGLLFTLSGAALLVITNVLVRSATGAGSCRVEPNGAVACAIPGHRGKGFGVVTVSGGFASKGAATRQAHGLSVLASSQNANDLHQLFVYSWIALAIMAVLSVALGWLIAGRVLRPLRTITTTARNISATNLHERLALSGPDDELKELGDTFDDLLARLEAFIQSQRQFVANAAHELRTPLAMQRTLVQLALSDPNADADSLRTAHERVLVSGAQQERLLGALLTLARGQTEPTRRERFDLSEVVEHVLLARRHEAAERLIDVRSSLAPTPLQGDKRLIERLVVNLIDNALRYNSDHGVVEVTSRAHDGGARLSVENSGPVVSPDDVERMLHPFQRLGSDRTGSENGFGLGLSIVDAVATAHGAALVIVPRPKGGVHVKVDFPPTHDTVSPDGQLAQRSRLLAGKATATRIGKSSIDHHGR